MDVPTAGTIQGEAEQERVNPLFAEDPEEQPALEPEAPDQTTTQEADADRTQAEAQQQEPILGRFKSTDELVKAYQSLEQHATQQAQVLAHLQRMFEAAQQTGNQPNAQQTAEAQPKPEFDFEQLLEKLRYEDPSEAGQALMEFAQTVSQRTMEGFLQQQQLLQAEQQRIQAQFAEAFAQVQDLDQIRPELEKALADYGPLAAMFARPDVDPRLAVNLLADAARGRAARSNNSATNWREQAIKDPEVIKAVIRNYQQGLQQSGPPPRVMGRQPGSGSPVAPNKAPTTLAEATRLMREHLEGQQTGG